MFEAGHVALQLVSAIAPIVRAVEAHDTNLADQLRRAVTSAALNTAEGGRRTGRDGACRYRIAAAECAETDAAVRIAVAWGFVDDTAAAAALGLADRLQAMLWRLRHPRR